MQPITIALPNLSLSVCTRARFAKTTRLMKIPQAVCVYAASSSKVAPVYLQAAHKLGTLLAQHRITLINGAGRTGLMAATTQGCLEQGGKAVGVIPTFMLEQNWQHASMSQLIEVDNMHERKQRMAHLSEGIVALPGGCGTLEELLEIITWKQLGLYTHPVVILNTNGFYDPLIAMLQRAVDERFMSPLHATIWQVASHPQEAIDLLLNTPEWEPSVRKLAAL